MRSHTDDRQFARRYLLHQLTESEQAEAQERLFLDPVFFEQIEISEDDLIDEYATGDVFEPDRAALAEFMKDSDRQQRAELARELRTYFGASVVKPEPPLVRVKTPRMTPWLALAMAASLVICVGATLYSIAQAGAVRREMALASEQTKSEFRALSARLSASPVEAKPALLMEPVERLRGLGDDTVTTITVAPTIVSISIRLLLPPGQVADRYNVTIQRADGAQVWGSLISPVASQPSAVDIAVTPSLLPVGDYSARVSIPLGARVAGYRFRVVGD